MKLKTLAKLCKDRGAFTLWDGGAREEREDSIAPAQWLGPPGAAYPLTGLPYLTEDNLCAMFDITEKQREDITFDHRVMPEEYNFSHTDSDEALCEKEVIEIRSGNRVHRPVFTRRDGLKFIDVELFLAPLSDHRCPGQKADILDVYERHTRSSPEGRENYNGDVYFAVKVGLLLAAVIMPAALTDERIVETLVAVGRNVRTTNNEQ